MSFKVPSKRRRDSSAVTPRMSRPNLATTLQKTSPPTDSVSRASSFTAQMDVRVLPEDDAAIEDREETDAISEVVMALDVRDRGTVGCCYYVAREEKLYFMEDIKFGGIELVDTRKWTR